MALETKSTPFGDVYRLVGGCKDDYSNIVDMEFYRKPSGVVRLRRRVQTITCQRPMAKALRAVEAACGFEVVVTGSARTCEFQAALYRKDPKRYAPPSVGLHCQALAIDTNTDWRTALTDEQERDFVRWMKHFGFTQARADEPWHWSYGWTA